MKAIALKPIRVGNETTPIGKEIKGLDDAEIKDDAVYIFCGHATPLAHSNGVLPQNLRAGDDVEPVALQPFNQLPQKPCVYVGQRCL